MVVISMTFAEIAVADKMSDNEEFLGDDFGDPSCDDTYNLGNEEEEILLAGGNIDCISRNESKIEDVNKDNSVEANNSYVDLNAVPDVSVNNNKPQDTDSNTSNQNSNVEADMNKLSNEEETTILNEITGNNRYRADQKERFPTERSELHGVNLANIPDSLDTVVTLETSNQQFRNRRQNNNRGRRMNTQRPMKDLKRSDFQRNQNFKNQPDNFGRIQNARQYPSDYRPYPKDLPPFRNVGPPPHPHDFRGGDFNMSSGFRPLEGSRPGEYRSMEQRLGNYRNDDGRPFHNMNSGPVNIRPPMDMRSGPPLHRDFMPLPPSNQRNFNPYPDNFGHPNRDNAPFQPLHDNIRQPNDRFMGMPRMSSHPNNFGPPNMGLLDNKVNHSGPPFHGPKNFTNVGPDFIPRKDIVDFDHSKNDNPKLGNANESKKVLINPHFKGVVPTDFMQQSQNDRPSTLNNFESFGNHPYNTNSSNYIPNRSNEFTNYRMGEYNRPGHNEQVNEKELQRATEQFINEQQKHLREANADFYEKTQRFIENTSILSRAQALDDEVERKKEYLKRKQEEFIIENDKFLNLRRRKNSPPRSVHRSPPSLSRHRTSPGRRIRGRLSISPAQNRREHSGEPEDKAYRVKLREQAEMRARVLQAKERRRRRDAANLLDKMNQPSAPTTSPKSHKNQNNTASNTNDKKMDNDSNNSNKDDLEPDSLKNKTDIKDSAHEEKPVKNQSVEEKPVKIQSVEEKPVKIQSVEEKHETKTTEKNIVEKMPSVETFEDIMDDDLLHLSPEDEDLFLSDEELILPSSFSKTFNSNISNSKPEKSPENNLTNKNSAKIATPRKSPVGTKRTANTDVREDLRAKLKKSNDVNEDKPNPINTQTTPPRRKIMFSNDTSKESSTKPQTNAIRGDKKETDRGSGNKWRSTFSEQKLDLTAPVAARAISAVMRNSTESRKVTKNDKILSTHDSIDAETENKSKFQNGSDAKSWNGRQVVMAKTTRRVVIPPRQKPLVVIENDEEESQEICEQINKSKNKIALVTGLPPGMTEARLLSLCGPEVEHVSVGAAGSADVSFNTAEACDRFVRRFHGRLVAASRLTVTTAN